MSCHAAMKEAGFRKDPTPLQVILRLLPKLDAHDRLLVAGSPAIPAHPHAPQNPHDRPQDARAGAGECH